VSETRRKPKRIRKNAEEIFHVRRVKKQDRAWEELENAQDRCLPKKKGFFELPRKLRDIVHYWLWQHSPCLDNHLDPYGSDLVRMVTTKTSENSMTRQRQVAICGGARSGLPLWLLTNKAFLNEDVAQLR
jgi:hypothetical protein